MNQVRHSFTFSFDETFIQRALELWQRQSSSGTIRYELDDEGFRVVLDQAQSRFLWQGLRRLWCYDDVWLIEIIKNQSAFFPPDAAGAPALEFIRERCRAAGVNV